MLLKMINLKMIITMKSKTMMMKIVKTRMKMRIWMTMMKHQMATIWKRMMIPCSL